MVECAHLLAPACRQRASQQVVLQVEDAQEPKASQLRTNSACSHSPVMHC